MATSGEEEAVLEVLQQWLLTHGLTLLWEVIVRESFVDLLSSLSNRPCEASGSSRGPAANHGVYGFRPSHSIASMDGVVPSSM